MFKNLKKKLNSEAKVSVLRPTIIGINYVYKCIEGRGNNSPLIKWNP